MKRFLIILTLISQPAMAAGANTQAAHNFLAGIAAKTGTIAPLPGTIRVQSSIAPTFQQYQQTIKALQITPVQHFSSATHTPDPTPDELNFTLDGNTDGDGNFIPDAIPGLLFGSLTPFSIDTYNQQHYYAGITGTFDDITNSTAPSPVDDCGNSNPAYSQYLIDVQHYYDAINTQVAADQAALDLINNTPAIPGVTFDVLVDTSTDISP